MLSLATVIILLSALISTVWGEKFTNPLRKKDGSDPWITFNNADKYYYLLTTTWKDVQITRARTLNGLKTGEKKVVYKDGNVNRCCNVWAPELHAINGVWYIYFTAGKDKDLGFQRLHVIRGGSSPWGSYAYAGQLNNEWGIDATVAVIQNRRYFYWSCQRNNLQSLCGAELTSPTKLGPTRFISSPTLPFEKHGKFPVNEGPEHLSHGGRDYLVYSASYCWTPNYSLGLLTLRDGGNPLDSKAWMKSGPIMTSANGNFGPGHNGFFKSPDGRETWIVYHATSNTKGACDGNRYTMAGLVNFTSAGPVFGAPPSLATLLNGPSGEP